MSGYTKVDNWLFDVVMPTVKPNTFKVISLVVRCTIGWGKERDTISFSQFQKRAGIISRNAVDAAITEAVECGYVGRSNVGQGFEYWIYPSTEIILDQYDNHTSTSTEIIPDASMKIIHTKERKDKDNIKVLSDHFQSLAGVFPNAGIYEFKWQIPLEAMYKQAGDLDKAKALIDRAFDFARNNDQGKRYSVTSPRSLVNIAANLNGTEPEAVKRVEGGGFHV